MKAIADVATHSIAELVSLAGRVAVVTGGGRGLGKAIALRLAEAGADVLIGDRDAELAAAAAQDLDARYSSRVIATAMDVTDSESITAAANLAVSQLGSVDIWVNNAGVFPSCRSPK
ncbi:MAG: SDR family NAD(P)-dependent oxidoreductase [Haliea sp.]|nr:SDR family NAD(P)-dependent oxidoreductase [Haliea sp.]